jgi:hypothetical protein
MDLCSNLWISTTEFSPNAIFLGTGVKQGEPKLNPPEKKSSKRSSAATKGIPAAKSRKTTKSHDSSASGGGVENKNDQGVQDEEDVLLPLQATRSTPQVTKDLASSPGRVKKGREKKKMDQSQATGASTDHSSVSRAKRNRRASQDDDFENY